MLTHDDVLIADTDSKLGTATAPAPTRTTEGSPTPPLGTDRRSGYALRRNLGDHLVATGELRADQLRTALGEQKRTGESLPVVLARLRLLPEDRLADILAAHYRLPLIEVPSTIPPSVLALVPGEIARKYQLVPVRCTESSIVIAMVDPTDLRALDDVAHRTTLRAQAAVASASAIQRAIKAAYGQEEALLDDVVQEADASFGPVETADVVDQTQLRAFAENAPVVRLVNSILTDAVRRGASDIHLDPHPKLCRVRFRIDGMLHEIMTIPKRLEPALMSRVKVMANLDIAERRLPQDGRIKLLHHDREMDYRVSVLPTVFGQSACLRLLNSDALALDLSALGLDPTNQGLLEKAIRTPHGMVVITGPTGSGKTTTLYAALQTVNSPGTHIVTLEDPVEYNLPGLNQVQVNDDIGLTFAAALRSFLRHDPNIILVGEVRDTETAQIAVRAALTGHLILTTLHTNDAASAVARLMDMDVAPCLLASALRLIVAQRLVRRICPGCREAYTPDPALLETYGLAGAGEPVTLYRGRGCEACTHTGLKGRLALYELLPITEPLRPLLMKGAGAVELQRIARKQGMRTLRDNGFSRALAGETTIEEVLRVTAD